MSHLWELSRRHLQVTLGVLWLVDAALQFQPFMFTTNFAKQVLAPAGAGQPAWVSGPVHVFAAQFGQHPVYFNTVSALVQLALGVGFLLRRTVRAAAAASIAWAIGVWYLGEGLGGLASGHASLLSGAPGAALLYGILAAASWPRQRPGGAGPDRPAAWLPWIWAALWVGGAILQLVARQNHAGSVAAALRGSAAAAPGWLGAIDRAAGAIIGHAGNVGSALLIAGMAGVGTGALIPGRLRTASAYAGGGLAIVFWVVAQNFGLLYSGQATDPNSGVLLVVFAAATAALAPGIPARSRTFARTVRTHDMSVSRSSGSAWPVSRI